MASNKQVCWCICIVFVTVVLIFEITEIIPVNIYDVISPDVTNQSALYESERLTRDSHQFVEDILCTPPLQFLDEYKNPCWKKEVSNNLRCIPYFQVIDMPKCGTSDLWDRITRHPDVIGLDGYRAKATNGWWSQRRYDENLKEQQIEDYCRYFENATKIIERSTDATGFHSIITGDASPMDMWYFGNWENIPQNKGLKEPKYMTQHLIHHVNPHTKFIIILRNPVPRMYSAFHFFKRYRVKTKENFHELIKKAIDDFQECLKSSTLKQCVLNRKINEISRIHIGFYSLYLKEWFNVFPKEQFLILQTEDYGNSTQSQLERVFEFLKVRKLSTKEMETLGMLEKTHKHATESKMLAGDMLEETRQLLTDLYQPYVKELYQMLHDKRFFMGF